MASACSAIIDAEESTARLATQAPSLFQVNRIVPKPPMKQDIGNGIVQVSETIRRTCAIDANRGCHWNRHSITEFVWFWSAFLLQWFTSSHQGSRRRSGRMDSVELSAEREKRLADLETRLAEMRVQPTATNMRVEDIERKARERLQDLQGLFARHLEAAQRVMERQGLR